MRSTDRKTTKWAKSGSVRAGSRTRWSIAVTDIDLAPIARADQARANDTSTGAVLVGAAALVFSLVYLASDLVELGQGGFSTFQLALTYAAEAAIPLFVLGLYAVQRPQIGRLGLVSALGYAYAFVFFTGTVTYALIDRTADWNALQDAWGPWITVHSILMVLFGIGFGIAVVRARVLPRWTGAALVAAMILMAVTVGAPDAVRTAAAGIRDLAFAAMGASLLLPGRRGGADGSGRAATGDDAGVPPRGRDHQRADRWARG